MPDLYGEMLARTLNRGAPPGHSAAYITPQEGRQLRASGGGVPPGGGQYMANGIPSFQQEGSTDPTDPGYDPGLAEPTGPTGGVGSMQGQYSGYGGYSSPASIASRAAAAGTTGEVSLNELASILGAQQGRENPAYDAARQMMAEARARQAAVDVAEQREVTTQALPAVFPAVQAGINIARSYREEAPPATPPQQTAAERAEEAAYGYAVGEEPPGAFIGNTPPGWGNIPGHARNVSEGYRNNPDNFDDYGDLTETGVQNAQNNQSEDGLGWQSPGAMGARVGMSFADLAALNSLSRDGGYSVNAQNPDNHDLRVSFLNARYNPNAANVAFGIGGLLSPTFMMGVNAINRRSPHAQYAGYQSPGFGNILGQGARAIGLGGVVDAFGTVRNEIGDVVSGITDPFTEAIGNVGTQIGGAFSPIGDFFGGRPPAVEGPSAPQDGGNQEIAFVPSIAPINEVAAPGEQPSVSDDTERQFANIPPDVLARIRANEEFGQRQQALANALRSQSAPIDTGIGFA